MTATPPSAFPPSPAAPLPQLAPEALAALQAAFADVRERILAATLRAGRAPASVRLLAVSKTFGPEVVAAAAGLGQRAFGENYAQEAVAKIEALGAPGVLAQGGGELEWHFIGPIQSNKTRLIARHFAWVQSLERASIALRLAAQRPAQLPALQVLLQVNISGETSKSGAAPQQLLDLAEQVAGLPRLVLRGLMAIPQADMSSAGQALAFGRLRELFEALRRRYPTVDTLSMGMSGDFEAAIAAGSTLVRVGSALFGERK